MRSHAPFEVQGLDGIVANFYSAKTNIRQEIRVLTALSAAETVRLTRAFCPVDTGLMRSSVKAELVPSGLQFSVFFDPSVFQAAGKVYYPLFVEFGTRFMSAQPSLRPAFAIVGPAYSKGVSDAAKRGIQSMRRAA